LFREEIYRGARGSTAHTRQRRGAGPVCRRGPGPTLCRSGLPPPVGCVGVANASIRGHLSGVLHQRDGSEGGRRTVHRPQRANDAAQGPSVGGDPDLHCIGPACRRYVGTRGSRARAPAAAFWGVPTPEGLSRVTEGDSRLALGQRGALRPFACPEGARPVAPIGGRTFAAVGSPTRRDPRQPRPESKVTQGPNPPPPRTVPRPTVLRAGRRRRASTSTTPGCAPPPYKKRRKRSSNDWPLARLF
jgi:hypothetical protein